MATARALKHHGGVKKQDLNVENIAALEKGIENLLKHAENITNVFGLPVVAAINKFPSDTTNELNCIEHRCRKLGVNIRLSEVWEKGGEGGIRLAEEGVNNFRFCYDEKLSIKAKIEMIAAKIYGANGVDFIGTPLKQMKELEKPGFKNYSYWGFWQARFSVPVSCLWC